ncbi:hypothetical protein [Flavobacterium phage FPSV-S27]|nr:hypothetical protein [Flavobacterium phage FPSV-S27]
MRKNPKTVEMRAEYVQNQINNRHKSETVEMAVSRLAARLFLSEPTIWNDYTKQITKKKSKLWNS